MIRLRPPPLLSNHAESKVPSATNDANNDWFRFGNASPSGEDRLIAWRGYCRIGSCPKPRPTLMNRGSAFRGMG